MWLFLKNHQHRAHVQHKLLLLLLQVIQNLDGASTSGQWQTLAQGSLVYPVYVKKSKMYINKLPYCSTKNMATALCRDKPSCQPLRLR